MEAWTPGAEPLYNRQEMDGAFPVEEGGISNEFRETLPTNRLAFMLIKPGFEQHFAEISKVIADHGLEVVYGEHVRLTAENVRALYQDAEAKHYYPDMVNYLEDRDVTVLLVSGADENTQRRLNLLKKTEDGQDGILRELFQVDERLAKDQLAQWSQQQHPDQAGITILLTQRNVVHTADSSDEARGLFRLFLGRKFDELRARGALPSELFDLFKEDTAI